MNAGFYSTYRQGIDATFNVLPKLVTSQKLFSKVFEDETFLEGKVAGKIIKKILEGKHIPNILPPAKRMFCDA